MTYRDLQPYPALLPSLTKDAQDTQRRSARHPELGQGPKGDPRDGRQEAEGVAGGSTTAEDPDI